jgi:hypothetical protein
VREACFDLEEECVAFTVYDDIKGDGISPPGGYAVVIDDKIEAEGSNFGAAERSYLFGQCGCGNGDS